MIQRPPNRAPQIVRIVLAGLCVLLILFIGAAQVLHTHTATESANPGCSLCAVAHLSVLSAPVVVFAIAFRTTAPVPIPKSVFTPPLLFSVATYVRPPPVLTLAPPASRS